MHELSMRCVMENRDVLLSESSRQTIVFYDFTVGRNGEDFCHFAVTKAGEIMNSINKQTAAMAARPKRMRWKW